MPGRREAKSLLESSAPSSSSSSEEEGSDPLLICAPAVTDRSDDDERIKNDEEDDDDGEDNEDMHSAMEVMVRFQDDDDDNDEEEVKQVGEDTTRSLSATRQKQQQHKKAVRAVVLTRKMIRKWLDFYVRFLQASPIHQDRLLKALQWTTWLASAVLEQKRNHKQHVASSSSSMALYKLSMDLSFARYATRLLELPVAVRAAWTGCWTASSVASAGTQDKVSLQKVYNWLGRGLSWSMVGYYPAEYAAYLLWMLPAKLQTTESNRKAAKFSAWSCRCWLVYLVSDLVQSLLQWKEQLQLQQQQQQEMRYNTTTTTPQLTSAKLQSLRSALFLLPCIHWALPNWDTQPWLPTKVVNGLMWMEAMVSLYQSSLALPGVEEEEEDEDTDKKEK